MLSSLIVDPRSSGLGVALVAVEPRNEYVRTVRRPAEHVSTSVDVISSCREDIGCRGRAGTGRGRAVSSAAHTVRHTVRHTVGYTIHLPWSIPCGMQHSMQPPIEHIVRQTLRHTLEHYAMPCSIMCSIHSVRHCHAAYRATHAAYRTIGAGPTVAGLAWWSAMYQEPPTACSLSLRYQ